MTDLTVYREYEPAECGHDGYPLVWHKNGGALRSPQRDSGLPSGALDTAIHAALDAGATHLDFTSGVKHLVRAEAGHRCVRCGHLWIVGESGSWGVAPGAEPPPAGLLALMADDADCAVRQEQNRPPLWSPCDERCEHGGPLRCLVDGQVAWLDAESPATKPPRAYGLDDRTVIQAAWRILTVHHINGRKHDLRWFNLAALCQRCHLVIQRKVQIERVYPFEHSAWFKPYAAGWYAYAYLGENLTRDAALARQDELLALEQTVDAHV